MSEATLHSSVTPSVRGLLLPARLMAFSAVVGLCCVLSGLGLLRGAAAAALAIGAVSIAMWHGAYDHVQARQVLAPTLGRRWLPAFLIGYAALAGAVLLGWWWFPLSSLVLFFSYSAWHFGTEPDEDTPGPAGGLVAFLLGAVPIVAACRWHGSEVVPILAAMVSHKADALANAQGLVDVLSFLCWPVLLAAALGVLAGALGQQRATLLCGLALQILLFRVCNPLTAFAAFFCCWHAPEHLLATSTGSGSLKTALRRNLRAGLLPWLVSLFLLGAAFAWGRHEWVAYQSELFVILSALTVPHMMLNELGRSQWLRRSKVRESFV